MEVFKSSLSNCSFKSITLYGAATIGMKTGCEHCDNSTEQVSCILIFLVSLVDIGQQVDEQSSTGMSGAAVIAAKQSNMKKNEEFFFIANAYFTEQNKFSSNIVYCDRM